METPKFPASPHVSEPIDDKIPADPIKKAGSMTSAKSPPNGWSTPYTQKYIDEYTVNDVKLTLNSFDKSSETTAGAERWKKTSAYEKQHRTKIAVEWT